MMIGAVAGIPPGLLVVLTTFVAVNAVMFAALAVAKILPKVYINDWIRGRSERWESRSIHPEPQSRRNARHRRLGSRLF